MPKSGRVGVQVVGSEDECYVVVTVPGQGVYRHGPMFEDEAIELAAHESDELRAAFSSPKVDNRELSKALDALWVMVILALGLWAALSYSSH